MMPDFVDAASDERVGNNTLRHQYRVLTDAEKHSMVRIKDLGQDFLDAIVDSVPIGRCSSLAQTKVEEAVMWAVKGITK